MNGRIYNLKRHEARVRSSRIALFGSSNRLRLRHYIQLTSSLTSGLVKCRITYGHNVEQVEYEKYRPKTIKTLKIINGDHVSYIHKYADRSSINSLYSQRGDNDDILIIKNGYVTDSSYSNVALLQGNQWYTPSTYLLSGTKRAQLIAQGKVKVRDIKVSDLRQYSKLCLFNAMIGFNKVLIDIDHINA